MGQIANVIGLFVGLAIVATLAAKPQLVQTFFSGVATDINAAQGA